MCALRNIVPGYRKQLLQEKLLCDLMTDTIPTGETIASVTVLIKTNIKTVTQCDFVCNILCVTSAKPNKNNNIRDPYDSQNVFN